MPLPPDLHQKRLVVVVGKGGTGRTTVAAALAVLLSQRGRNVLLYQANSKEKLSGLLGGPPVGQAIVRLRDRLWAVNPNPADTIHEYGVMILRYETIYRMVFENRLSKALVRAIPGIDDYALLGKMWFHTTEESAGRWKYDTVVFDAPATGHASTMLRIPRAILHAVPEGPLTRDAQKVRALLEDPARTATLLCTLAEEMPTNETIELAERLEKEIKIRPSGVVVNQLYPDRFDDGTAAGLVLDALSLEADADLAPMVARARLSRDRRELNEIYLERLRRELPLPLTELPMIFRPSLGPTELAHLVKLLERELGRGQGLEKALA
ncbi:MAG TPA: ArsA family ATPase [Haliangiales bacterium]|nr:ArsA family ATPase [Haliangiales bacterium]